MYSVIAAATGQASCVLREMGLGPRDRCTVKIKYGDMTSTLSTLCPRLSGQSPADPRLTATHIMLNLATYAVSVGGPDAGRAAATPVLPWQDWPLGS